MLKLAVRPAVAPGFTAIAPNPSGRSTDARGFGDTETCTPPETVRLPCPETVAISLTLSALRSDRSAGITKYDMVWPSALPNVGSPSPDGNAFRYSRLREPLLSKPKLRSPSEPLTLTSSAP